MFNAAKRLINDGYDVVYNHDTRIPKTYICPHCLERMKQFTNQVVLQRRAAKNVVIGAKVDGDYSFKLAVCSKCDFTKSE